VKFITPTTVPYILPFVPTKLPDTRDTCACRKHNTNYIHISGNSSRLSNSSPTIWSTYLQGPPRHLIHPSSFCAAC